MGEKKDQCSVKVVDHGGWHLFNCTKPVTITRKGKDYCTIHDPEYIKKKREKQQRKYDEKWERISEQNRDRCLVDSRVIELVKAAKPAQRILDVLNQNGLLPSGEQGVLARLLVALKAMDRK